MDSKHNTPVSDQASVKSSASFGSTVGLIKNSIGFSSSSGSSKDSEKSKSDAQKSAKQSSQTYRSQVNIVG